MRRHFVLAAPIVAGALLLGGCSQDTPQSPETSTSSTTRAASDLENYTGTIKEIGLETDDPQAMCPHGELLYKLTFKVHFKSDGGGDLGVMVGGAESEDQYFSQKYRVQGEGTLEVGPMYIDPAGEDIFPVITATGNGRTQVVQETIMTSDGSSKMTGSIPCDILS